MSAAIAAVVGAQLASAYFQWKNSEAARKASAEEHKRMEELFNKVRAPDFDPSDFTPEDYQVVGTYIPQIAPLIEEAAPQVVKGQSQDAIRGREVEREMLEAMLAQARGGEDPLANIERARAARQAAGNAQSQRATLEAQMARRGVAPGSLAQYGASMAANQDAALREALAGEQAAENSLRRRDSMLGQSAQLGQQMRNSDLNLEAQNAAIINAFNQRIAATRNQYNQNAMNTLNEGQRYNLGVGQDVSNRSIAGRNDAKKFNFGRDDQNKQQGFANDMSMFNTRHGLSNDKIAGITQSAADKNAAISGLAGGLSKAAMYGGGSGQAAAPAAAASGQTMALNQPEPEYGDGSGYLLDPEQRRLQQQRKARSIA